MAEPTASLSVFSQCRTVSRFTLFVELPWRRRSVANHARAAARFADIPAGERLFRRGGGVRRFRVRRRRTGWFGMSAGRGFRECVWRRREDAWGFRRCRQLGLPWRLVPDAPDVELARDDNRAVIGAGATACREQRRAQNKSQESTKHQQYPQRFYSLVTARPPTDGLPQLASHLTAPGVSGCKPLRLAER